MFQKEPKIIVTGEKAENIVRCCRKDMTVDRWLILKGLMMIYERNS